eukprot:6213823-Pleurochrysis_carterae.AAC.1
MPPPPPHTYRRLAFQKHSHVTSIYLNTFDPTGYALHHTNKHEQRQAYTKTRRRVDEQTNTYRRMGRQA